MTDSIETYRTVLRHVVRPDDPLERSESRSVYVTDYEALMLKWCLHEYHSYGAPTDEYREIATGYIEYIKMCVYDENKNMFRLFFHTDTARRVLEGALLEHPQGIDDEWVDSLLVEISETAEAEAEDL